MSLPSLIFMAPDETTSQEAAAAAAKPESAATKTRGRKPSNKAPNSKKQPQRGLGVAQLERLRLQEHRKKITEIPHLHPFNFLPDHFHFPAAAAEPLESVPVQYGAGGYGGAHRLMAAVQQQRMGTSAGFGCGSHYHYHQGVNNVGSSGGGHHVVMMQQPAQDQVNHMKKRFNGDQMNGGTREILQMGGLMNFFGHGPNSCTTENVLSNSAGELSLGFGTTPQATTSSINIPQNIINHDHEGVEVVAVHRKGNPSVNGENVFMEYEFFPGKNDNITSIGSSGTTSKMMQILPKEFSSLGHGEEASYYANAITTATNSTTYGADTFNPLDLSLKL
ncbi:uncharacterized protein LOC21390029 isoform X1 [Morus notabilis]|uniref:uncharacterized protein LOC21390029 isoform X1 n=1 Tax=Morus notabilis TaxID=981085 RepID=UPI000CED7E70|nr:uncharacterized protein LOC21390029 isoform X1 [Morus notabilis]